MNACYLAIVDLYYTLGSDWPVENLLLSFLPQLQHSTVLVLSTSIQRTLLGTLLLLLSSGCRLDTDKLEEEGMLVQVWEKEGLVAQRPLSTYGDLERKLFEATLNDDFDRVVQLIDDGADVNATNEQGEDLIELAIRHENLEMVVLFTRSDLEPSADALVLAIHLQDDRFWRHLVKQSPNINQLSRVGSTPLVEAIRWGDPSMVEACLKLDARIKLEDSRGMVAQDYLEIAENMGNFPDFTYNYEQIKTMLESKSGKKP